MIQSFRLLELPPIHRTSNVAHQIQLEEKTLIEPSGVVVYFISCKSHTLRSTATMSKFLTGLRQQRMQCTYYVKHNSAGICDHYKLNNSVLVS